MVPEHNQIFLYRIIHIDNLNYILEKGKITCPNHIDKDINYIGIGDQSLIESRRNKSLSREPFGTFTDYISFYFSNRSPMLYNIFHGFNKVILRSQNEIIYLVTNYQKIKESGSKFIYFDGHGYHHLSECFNDDSGLEDIDWEIIKSNEWSDTNFDTDRKRKKQAEFLVYSEFDINFLLGIGVYNEEVQQKIVSLLKKKSLNLKCLIKESWYY